MTRAADHYSLLGVAPEADAAEIRAAYLRLIKESHPDRGCADAEERASASALNEAYAVLKDPERRRTYDLGRRLAAGAPAVIVPPRPPWPQPQRRRRVGWWVGLPVVIGLAWVAALLGQRAYEQTAPRTVVPDIAANEAAEEGSRRPGGWVDDTMIEQAVENLVALRAGGSAADIERYSATCFAQFEAEPTTLRADHCIAFDVAAATIGPAGRMSRAPPRSELVVRHTAALRRVIDEPVAVEMRLREIRAETVSALLRRASVNAKPDRVRD